MPITCWSDVNCQELVKIGLATMVPIGLGALGWAYCSSSCDPTTRMTTLRKPSWGIGCTKTTATIDLLCSAPVGCAGYLIYKEFPSADRDYALGLYGATMVYAFIGFPAFSKLKSLKGWAGLTALNAAAFGATGLCFYRINPFAGWLLAPVTAWLCFETAELIATYNLNKADGPPEERIIKLPDESSKPKEVYVKPAEPTITPIV